MPLARLRVENPKGAHQSRVPLLPSCLVLLLCRPRWCRRHVRFTTETFPSRGSRLHDTRPGTKREEEDTPRVTWEKITRMNLMTSRGYILMAEVSTRYGYPPISIGAVT